MTNLIMGKLLNYILYFGWLPLFLMGLLGLILGYILWGMMGRRHEGDLTLEGEGALRAEADGLRARIRELESQKSSAAAPLAAAALAGGVAVAGDPLDDTAALRAQIRDLEAKLEAGGSADAATADDDETYALEWRNRYLAARVKYLEGRLSDAPAPKKKAVAKKAAPAKKKAPAKKAPAKKAVAKKAAAPKVLYTDGPTDGTPDDLKAIKGIGPKFEKDLNGKGIYYFRQIGNWKKKDVDMVEELIDSIPGRIERDEWVSQAKGLAKGGKAKASAKKPAAAKKKPAAKKAKSTGVDYDKYFANVKKFDGGADRATVDSIVKYLGASLRSRDSSLVACSDAKEVDTVVKNFAMKKLGLERTAGEDLVKTVCQDMKSERFKNRVTFYYLCAKKAGKLSVFG